MYIRFAENRDIPGMIALLQQVGEVHHRIRPDLFRSGAQKYDHEDLALLLKDENRPILIADVDGTVAGYAFCILQQIQGDCVLCDRKVLYIDDICVDETKRGQGIATALYNRVLEFARELGCHSVTLNVWCGNDGAMKFYEKCGMKPQKIGMETILC
jgi:ribosomal protein S18 acetylase RimI-like enzyme